LVPLTAERCQRLKKPPKKLQKICSVQSLHITFNAAALGRKVKGLFHMDNREPILIAKARKSMETGDFEAANSILAPLADANNPEAFFFIYL